MGKLNPLFKNTILKFSFWHYGSQISHKTQEVIILGCILHIIDWYDSSLISQSKKNACRLLILFDIQ